MDRVAELLRGQALLGCAWHQNDSRCIDWVSRVALEASARLYLNTPARWDALADDSWVHKGDTWSRFVLKIDVYTEPRALDRACRGYG